MMVLDDSPVFHATFLGAIRIGAVPIPVNPMDRTDNYAYYLDDSYAKVLVVEAALLDKVEPALAGRPALHVLVANGDPRGHTSFDDAVAVAARRAGAAPADTHPDDMAFWLYSSGSTGRPKGVVHTQRDIGATIDTYARHVLKITEDDLCYSTTKLFHAYGLGNGLSFPLSAGATDGAGARPVASRTASSRPSRATPPRCSSPSPPCTRRCSRRRRSPRPTSRAPAPASRRPSRSAPRSRSAGRRRPACRSSTGSGRPRCCTSTAPTRSRTCGPGTSGTPVPGYDLRVIDEHGQDAAAGEAGDLLVRGESCAAFYWHQREKTRHCMRGEWFYTGDRYVKTADGHFVYQGRADDMIKVGGLWVAPADVEACLIRHPAVSEAAVIGVTLDDVSRVKAFVICAEEPAEPDALADELRQWCKEHLRRYEYPHVVDFVEDFPRTVDGQDPALQAPRGRGEACRPAGLRRRSSGGSSKSSRTASK